MRLANVVLAMGLLVAWAGAAAPRDRTGDDQYAGAATRVLSAEAQRAEAVMAYWTPERMASARPMPIPTRVGEEGSMPQSTPAPPGPPAVVNGWRPGGPPYVAKERTFTWAEARAMAGQAPQTFGTAPTDPLNGPYGPFQRWTMEGNYLPFARGIHGKLFFTMAGENLVCSATVIARSTIATAGHCVNSGPPNKAFGGNFLFCPSYYNGGPSGAGIPHPSRGCWSWNGAGSTAPWIQSGDPDYDYACIALATTGTVVASKVGNVTGWAGLAFNWTDAPEMIFGYPAASPFTGQIIEQVATVDWYGWDGLPGGPASKVVGSDLTGGSSGGGWFLSWRAPGAEFPDTDGNSGTDPAGTGGPYLNGVNSHQRCLVNCSSPPTASAGVFWQEMTSPPFWDGGGADMWDAAAFFGRCLADPINNP